MHRFLSLLCLCLALTVPAPANPAVGTPLADGVTARAFADTAPKLTFDHDVSTILGAEDDYTRTLSTFDYAAKYKSDKPLSPKERAAAFKQALETYNMRDIQRLQKAFDAVFKKMNGIKVRMPETIHIFSESRIEAGAAYTRANTICMPINMIRYLPDSQLSELAAHETFHVLSRYNRDLRPQIYATLGFQPVKMLVLEGNLARRTIANPDAPDNNYTIKGSYKGETLQFMPILYSDRNYAGGSFFQYLHDDLIAVEIKDGTPKPIKREGKPLIVRKEEVQGYFDQIGRNTSYTFHPEETAADHFKILLLQDPRALPNAEKITALGKILKP